MAAITLLIGALLGYANGANDNFKGVATLFGSGTARYRTSLYWATATTALGSVTALYLAQALLTSFTGRGLVPDSVAADPGFALAVAFGAGATVLLATRFGFPVSTTHALIGGLVGVGLRQAPDEFAIGGLATDFIAPLLTSPFLAIACAALLYPVLHWLRRRLGITRQTCVCLGREVVATVPGRVEPARALSAVSLPSLTVADDLSCKLRYDGRMVGISASTIHDVAHFLSAGAVSFARGVNDTPKIAALLLAGSWFSPTAAISIVTVAIMAGGLLSARRVAETMAHRITDMTPGQGLTSNLITASLVIGASNLGLPVSTTHVACGALFGIGTATRQAHWGMIGRIVAAWVVTLPAAALLGFAFSYVAAL